jgi:Uma2 family endonuclease
MAVEQTRIRTGVRQPPSGKITYEEFLTWADEDTLAEWVDGEVIMYSPASRQHQDIAGFLFELLKNYVSVHNLGRVLFAPFQMKLESRPSGREPDLLFIATERLELLRETYLDGPADLVVEVISPESAGRDRGDKFYEYERAGVREYWLIDPERKQAEFYNLTDEGYYQVAPPDAEGRYRARVVPGFWLRVEWLWRDPPPSLMQLLATEDEWRDLLNR